MEQSKISLEHLKTTVDELINVYVKQKQDFAQKLALAQNTAETDAKIQHMQNEIDNKANKINGLQTEVQNLNNALTNRKAQIEELDRVNKELAQKCQELEAKNAEIETALSQTSENIEYMVAKLEKVLEENGAGNN